MADILLRYGPGATATVLKTSLKSMTFKAKLSIEVQELENELQDEIHLHLGSGIGEEGPGDCRRRLRFVIACSRSGRSG